MTQEMRWLTMWQQYMDFLHNNKRRPSKYADEEKNLVNWAKHNRKIQNKVGLPENRRVLFEYLLSESKKYQRVNQHQYVDGTHIPSTVVEEVADL